MTTVYFKTSSGATAKSFSAYYIEVFFDSEETKYTDISWNQKKKVHGKYKGWDMVLGYIATEADLDYLAELPYFETPQFSLNGSTYYDINVKSVKPKKIGSTIAVLKQAKEV